MKLPTCKPWCGSCESSTEYESLIRHSKWKTKQYFYCHTDDDETAFQVAERDAKEAAMYAAMDDMVKEIPPVITCPHCEGEISTTRLVSRKLPDAELRLRRDLAEWTIWNAATIEVKARPYVDPMRGIYEKAGIPSEFDPNIERHAKQRKAADIPAREREVELLAFSRMPNWETDEPPPLTKEEADVLAKWVALGAKYPGSRAFDELRMKVGLSAHYTGDRECVTHIPHGRSTP